MMKTVLTFGNVDSLSADLIVVPVRSEGTNPAFDALNQQCGGALSARALMEDFKGQKDRTLIWEGAANGKQLRLIAVGIASGADASDLRLGIGRAVRFASAHSLSNLAIVVDGGDADAVGADAVGADVVGRKVASVEEAVLLSDYQFLKYKGKSKQKTGLKQLTVAVLPDADGNCKDNVKKAAERAVVEGRCRGEAVNLARDLVNEPANLLSPSDLADRASALAEQHGLECEILNEKEIKKLKMGLLLSVAAGSDRPPRFIHLIYRPKKKPSRIVALIGKGITFDSGGLCIKPGKSMADMKTDMAGAAAVLAMMGALKTLDVRAEVHGIIPTTDNGINGNATRPGDVFKSMSGKTVEIVNTDAEGRLILADAMTFALGLKPDILVDIATLTGSCEVALGSTCAGLFSKRDEDAAAFEAAARESGESVWRLPLLEDLDPGLKSEVADLRNVGGRVGGAISAALFLKHFTGNSPWVHFDIAGPARLEKATSLCRVGGTGFGVLLGLTYLSRL